MSIHWKYILTILYKSDNVVKTLTGLFVPPQGNTEKVKIFVSIQFLIFSDYETVPVYAAYVIVKLNL